MRRGAHSATKAAAVILFRLMIQTTIRIRMISH
jgi:hypothetical protein